MHVSLLVIKINSRCLFFSQQAQNYGRFTFARIVISYARFFFYESAEKVLSYARLNCAVFNYFYMSLGQVRHTIVVSREISSTELTKNLRFDRHDNMTIPVSMLLT